MKLRNLFGKTKPSDRMSPLLQAMAAEIPRWPVESRPLMERIVSEAHIAGVSSMDEFSAFLDSHPDLQAGFYATIAEGFGPEGKQMLYALKALEIEGMVMKRKNSVYASLRSCDWLKVKTSAGRITIQKRIDTWKQD